MHSTPTFLFVLGRVTALAKSEFHHLLQRYALSPKIVYEDTKIIIASFPIEPPLFWEEAGGLIRVARYQSSSSLVSLPHFLLSVSKEKKITFGLSLVDGQKEKIHTIAAEVKDELEKQGNSVRYVLPEKNGYLSSVQVQRNKLLEHHSSVILKEKKEKENSSDNYEIFVDEWVQPFEAFAQRDYQRPYTDPKRGMLPPKVSRMMVNLALPKVPSKSYIVYDPFCGSGTILLEALNLGFDILGSDIAKECVEGTRKNLDWLRRISPNEALKEEEIPQKIFQSDAVRIGERVGKAVDAIVTEPFLGRLFISPPTPGRAENTIKGLGKLYLGFFRVAKTVLKKEGRIAIIFPRIRSTTNVYTIPQGIISKIETLGYTLEEDPLLYDRPHAIVQRLIYIFGRV
ncbi:MAG TPA: DNA methyltransferase [Patescibacteria group bacterium]|nr:DNA methyltransferase [Patescibacteria group bacterium]